MMNRRGIQSRPPMPVQLLDMSPDEYFDWLIERGYSEHAAENELKRLEVFHGKYLPKRKKAVNDVPIKDTTDKAYKALERLIRKRNAEDDES